MQIKKRNGDVVAFDVEKIRAAMRKAFAATGVGIEESELDKLSLAVQQSVEKATALTVENVQDRVEQELMAAGYYETAKAYVLYREERAKLRRARESIAAQFKDPSLERVLREIERDFSSPAYAISILADKFERFARAGMSDTDRERTLVKAAVELITMSAPSWEFIAARLYNHFFTQAVAEKMQKLNLRTFHEKLIYMTDERLYGRYILESYSLEELRKAEAMIRPERDRLFTYAGLELLLKRYVIRTRAGKPMETPQEMFLGIALHLAMNEPKDRMTCFRQSATQTCSGDWRKRIWMPIGI